MMRTIGLCALDYPYQPSSRAVWASTVSHHKRKLVGLGVARDQSSS